jgi:hypothetical protein
LTPEAAQLLKTARQHLAGILQAASPCEVCSFGTLRDAKPILLPSMRQRHWSTSEPEIDQSFATFLAEAYELKSIADYGANPATDVSADGAWAAIDTAERLIECIAKVIA